MGDLKDKNASEWVKLTDSDETNSASFEVLDSKARMRVDATIRGGNSPYVAADVNTYSGVKKLETNASVVVEEIFGQDRYAGSWYRIENAGTNGGTHTITIGASSSDPSSPDADRPQYQKTITTTASEAGNEIALRDKVYTTLTADSTFMSYFKCRRVKDNPIIYIGSKFLGEFWETTTFSVTTTDAVAVTIGFTDFKMRGKPTSLSVDQNDPRVGILGISGEVSVIPAGINNKIKDYLKNAGSRSMLVNGSVTPVLFTFNADSTGIYDYFITQLSFNLQDNGIKYGQFGAKAALTNGILLTIVSDGNTYTGLPITMTDDFKHEFTDGLVSNYRLDVQAGRDDMVATQVFPQPIVLKAGSSDKVQISIRDNITTSLALDCLIVGFKKEI